MLGCILLSQHSLLAQEVNWLSFEALDDSLQQQEKPVVIYFHTDWCAYCRKMEKQVFSQEEIAGFINEYFYAVKMNAESKDTIYFEGQAFVNPSADKNRDSVHQLAQIFSRQEKGFTAPTFVVLNKDFRVRERHYQYLSPQKMMQALSWP